MSFFNTTKLVSQTELQSHYDIVCPSAFIHITGKQYLQVDLEDMRRFLAHTRIEANKYRDLTNNEDDIEFVCRTYSAMLWFCLDQQRVKEGHKYSFTAMRATSYNHAFVIFQDTKGDDYYIEPQSDAIIPLDKWVSLSGNNTVNTGFYV